MSPQAAIATQSGFREKAPEPRFGEGLPPQSAALLYARIKDLRLHLAGTPLETYIARLYEELDAKGISIRPECYLSDQWGCPNGVPVIGIPFYLADPKLHTIEEALGDGAEDEADIMMYLRHEAGHAINYAYKLYETAEFLKVFGDYSKPYIENYKPKPFSRKYVMHISGWYAQKHPDEDFAETFAVWLTPDSEWATKYKAWGALKKLHYVEHTMAQLGRKEPVVTFGERDIDVAQMEETVFDHYRLRNLEEHVDVQIGDHLDQDLIALFEASDGASTPADVLLRAEKQAVIHAVTQYSGVSRSVVKSVYDHLLDRTHSLGLTVHRDKSRDYMTRVTSLLSTLAMNYLYTDRFFEVE